MTYSKSDVVERFEALFQDKVLLPDSLIDVWFDMAVAQFTAEIDSLDYNPRSERFGISVDSYVISILAEYIKQYYMEREVSKINKRVSIVGKDLSIDGSNGSKKYAAEELAYIKNKVSEMVDNLKPTAYN